MKQDSGPAPADHPDQNPPDGGPYKRQPHDADSRQIGFRNHPFASRRACRRQLENGTLPADLQWGSLANRVIQKTDSRRRCWTTWLQWHVCRSRHRFTRSDLLGLPVANGQKTTIFAGTGVQHAGGAFATGCAASRGAIQAPGDRPAKNRPPPYLVASPFWYTSSGAGRWIRSGAGPYDAQFRSPRSGGCADDRREPLPGVRLRADRV